MKGDRCLVRWLGDQVGRGDRIRLNKNKILEVSQMLEINKNYVLDINQKPIAVQIPIADFEKIEEILEDYGLAVSAQYFGGGNYSGCHDQPKELREEPIRIIVAREGIVPVSEMRSRTYSKKLMPFLTSSSYKRHKSVPSLSPFACLSPITNTASLHHCSGS